jgi:hypothetical protein
MLLAEEFLLLSLDEESGKKTVSSEKLSPALGGAILVELALLERIGVTAKSAGWNRRGRVTITSTKPTDDAELDAALQTLEERENTKVSTLVSDMSGKRITKGLRDRLLERLVRARILTETRTDVLGLRRWPVLDRTVDEEIRRRLQSCLVGEANPTERTVALIALLYVTGHLTKVVSTDDKKALKKRAKALTEGDWAAAAVKQAIDEVYATLAASAAAAGGGNGGGGG